MYLKKKRWDFLLLSVSMVMNIKKIFKGEKLIKISKILGLFTNIEEYQKIYNHAWRKYNLDWSNLTNII